MKRAELNFAQKVWLESLWLGARFFAVLPYWFKYYVVENLLFFILYYCLRYRMKVVNENLRNSFPEKSVGELAVIRRNFYRTLAEIFVDTVNMAHMGEEKARTVLTVKGFDEHYKAVHGPRLDRYDGPFRLLGVLFLLGALRTLADVGGGVSSPAQQGHGAALPAFAQL